MVIDLRLDHEVADLLEQRIELGDTYNLEACRAYLGCYYLSGMYAANLNGMGDVRLELT